VIDGGGGAPSDVRFRASFRWDGLQLYLRQDASPGSLMLGRRCGMGHLLTGTAGPRKNDLYREYGDGRSGESGALV